LLELEFTKSRGRGDSNPQIYSDKLRVAALNYVATSIGHTKYSSQKDDAEELTKLLRSTFDSGRLKSMLDLVAISNESSPVNVAAKRVLNALCSYSCGDSKEAEPGELPSSRQFFRDVLDVAMQDASNQMRLYKIAAISPSFLDPRCAQIFTQAPVFAELFNETQAFTLLLILPLLLFRCLSVVSNKQLALEDLRESFNEYSVTRLLYLLDFFTKVTPPKFNSTVY